MLIFLIFNTILSGFFSLIWKTKGWYNVALKVAVFVQLVFSLFFLGQTLGYIVKG